MYILLIIFSVQYYFKPQKVVVKLKNSIPALLLAMFLIFSNSCNKDEENTSLNPVADFTADVNEIYEGESVQFTDLSTNEPTSWAWNFGEGSTSTQQNPSHTYETAGTYTVSLTATNDIGSDTEAKTNYITVASDGGETGTVTDIDGNTYNTVTIGTETWMAENLKATKYPNGTAITLVTDNTAWANLGDNDTDKAYCYYKNESTSQYGALYTYAAAKDACPSGWHLPTDAEWTTLENYISNDGHNGTEGTALKSTSGWNSNGNGTDNYGFSALPGGYRNGSSGPFGNAGDGGYWWSSTESGSSTAYRRNLDYDYAYVRRLNYYKSNGLSVRCLRDQELIEKRAM